jgi:hypothetical protein
MTGLSKPKIHDLKLFPWPQIPTQKVADVKYFLHNHLRFTILYHKDAQTDLARIVGFEVEPFSVKHEYEAPWDKASPVLNTCNPGRMIYVTHDAPPQPVVDGTEVIFSYDVKFVVGFSPTSNLLVVSASLVTCEQSSAQ